MKEDKMLLRLYNIIVNKTLFQRESQYINEPMDDMMWFSGRKKIKGHSVDNFEQSGDGINSPIKCQQFRIS